jgi:hypothetical protein
MLGGEAEHTFMDTILTVGLAGAWGSWVKSIVDVDVSIEDKSTSRYQLAVVTRRFAGSSFGPLQMVSASEPRSPSARRFRR